MCFSVLVKKTFENSFGEQFKDSFKWLFYSLSDFDRQVNMCSPMLRRLRPSKYPWLSMQCIKYMNFIHNTFCGTHIWNYPHCLYFCLMVEVKTRRAVFMQLEAPFTFSVIFKFTGPQSGESQTLWQHGVYSKAWKQKATALQRNTAALQDYVQKGLYVDNPQ